MKVSELVTSPCPEDRDAMAGDERARFCGRCQLHVVDLGAEPRAEAEARLGRRGEDGPRCVRVHHDHEGNVATRGAADAHFLSGLQAIVAWRGRGGAS